MNILITGTSRGLGRALAEECLRLGHAVWGLARTRPDGMNQKMQFSRCDIGIPEDVIRVYSEMNAAGFPPDAVILNAAIIKDDINSGIVDMETVRESVQANLLGHIHLMSLLLPIFRNSPSGGIFVNVSSLSSFRAIVKGKLAYPATKAAMDMFFESLRIQSKNGQVLFTTVNLGPLADKKAVPLLTATYHDAARRIIRRIEKRKPGRGFSYPLAAACIFRLAGMVPDSFIGAILKRIKRKNNLTCQ